MATKITSTRAAVEAAFADAMKKDNMCPVGKIISEHEAGDVIADKVKDDLHYSATTIARVLKGLGLPPLSTEAINKHRRGACRCQ